MDCLASANKEEGMKNPFQRFNTPQHHQHHYSLSISLTPTILPQRYTTTSQQFCSRRKSQADILTTQNKISSYHPSTFIMMTSLQRILTISTLLTSSICHAFTNPINHPSSLRLIQSPISSSLQAETLKDTAGNLHGESACFLPILQNDDEYIAPRIVQVCAFSI